MHNNIICRLQHSRQQISTNNNKLPQSTWFVRTMMPPKPTALLHVCVCVALSAFGLAISMRGVVLHRTLVVLLENKTTVARAPTSTTTEPTLGSPREAQQQQLHQHPPQQQQQQQQQQEECSPCLVTYLETVRALGVTNRGVSHEEWRQTLCRPALPASQVSHRPLLIGAGPGTTASRSFALALHLMGRKSVLHWKVGLTRRPGEHLDKAQIEHFRVDDLSRGLEDRAAWDAVNEWDFRELYDNGPVVVDAILDWPMPMYTLDILRRYPNARILLTHRDPVQWFHRRKAFCAGKTHTPACDVPFLLRPLGLHLANLTEAQAVGSYTATEDALECLVSPDRFLKVDAWHPPPEPAGWLPHITRWMGVDLPPAESMCDIPVATTHWLTCGGADERCQACQRYMRNEYQQKNQLE